MRLTIRLVVFAFVLGALAACAPRTRPPAPASTSTVPTKRAVLPPVFEVLPGLTSLDKFNPPGTGSSIALTVGARVVNPNPFPVQVRAVDYRVFLEETRVGEGVVAPMVLLPAGGSETVSFEVTVNLDTQPGLLRSVGAAFLGEPLPFRLEGTVSTAELGSRSRFGPYAFLEGATASRQTVSPPVLHLDETQSAVFLLEAGVPVVRVVVRADNTGDIGYFLYGNDLELRVANRPLATADLTPVPVPAGETGRVELLFYPDANLAPATREALNAAMNGIPTSLELRGDLFLDVLGVNTFQVPGGWEVLGFISSARGEE